MAANIWFHCLVVLSALALTWAATTSGADTAANTADTAANAGGAVAGAAEDTFWSKIPVPESFLMHPAPYSALNVLTTACKGVYVLAYMLTVVPVLGPFLLFPLLFVVDCLVWALTWILPL